MKLHARVALNIMERRSLAKEVRKSLRSTSGCPLGLEGEMSQDKDLFLFIGSV